MVNMETRMQESDELFPIIASLSERKSILLSADMLEDWKYYEQFIMENVAFPCEILLVNYSTITQENVHLLSISDCFDILDKKYYSCRLIFYFVKDEIIIYNQHTENISFVITEPRISDKYQTDWDKRFCHHLANSGVGFGVEGQIYMKKIVNIIIKSHPSEADRFSKILASVWAK